MGQAARSTFRFAFLSCRSSRSWGRNRRSAMRIHGIVRIATLEENPPGSDRIEMHIRVQGVRPDQPRLLVVPYELLLGDQTLEPDQVQGKGFDAEVSEA